MYNLLTAITSHHDFYIQLTKGGNHCAEFGTRSLNCKVVHYHRTQHQSTYLIWRLLPAMSIKIMRWRETLLINMYT